MAQFPSAVATDSNLYVAVNSLATSLVGALTSSGGNYSPTEIQVFDTTGFPTSGGFITIDTEAISYTGISSGPARFTGISRGADGTIASAHNSGVAVKLNVIAAHHNTLKEEVKAIEQNLSDRLGLSSTQNIIPVGSISAPSLTFLGDLNTGLYWNSADKFSIVTNGSDRLTFDGATISSWALFRAANGSAASPSISFINDPNSGFYSGAGDDVYLSLGGVGSYSFLAGQMRIPNGTQAAPGLSFGTDTDTGIAHEASGYLTLTYNNTAMLRLRGASGDARWTLHNVAPNHHDLGNATDYWARIYLGDGTVTLPAVTFGSNTDCGMYLVGSDINFSVNNSLSFSIQANYIQHSRDTIPTTDGTLTLGKTGNRWSAVWAANGTIQTSHSSTKANIVDIDPEQIELPRGVFYDRDGRRWLGYLNDSLPDEGRPVEDKTANYEQAMIGVLCAHVRKLEQRISELESKEI